MQFPRPMDSEREIAALPALGTTEFEVHVRAHGDKFTPETLVYLLRLAAARKNTPLFELCGRFLVGRVDDDGRWSGGHCEGIMVNLGKSFGFVSDPEEMIDFRARCQTGLWQAIHGKSPFWESRFGRAFRQKCIEAARSLVRQQQKWPERLYSDGEDSFENLPDSEVILMDEDVASRLSSPANQATLLREVRRLPRRQAHAVLLAWMNQRPIEGGPRSVANLMGISSRMVYKHLSQALPTLQANPVLRAIWFGEV
jgi:hypothetical protein